MQPLLAGSGVVAGIGVIMMVLIAPPPVCFSYYAGLILIFMMLYTVIKLRFIWASVGCWLLVVLYELAAIFLSETPVKILINNNFFFIGANFIGMFAAYAIEYYARRDFFLKNLLEVERAKVIQARDLLEERVQERTEQLFAMNVKLQQEMVEHQQAEAEKRQIQQQLIRHQKMESIGLMAGGVAHDLNNILSGIISYPELLLMDLPEESELRKPLEVILQSGNRAAAVVADLLTVARGIASQQEVVCVNDLVENYLASPEHQKIVSLYPEVSLSVDFKPDLPDCKCSPVHIQKVLMNLVNNAFEAIEMSGEILISTRTEQISNLDSKAGQLENGEYVVLRVADSGAGISDDNLEHVFEPFYTKKVMGRSGTGLGLAVVWSTVQEHDGVVDVESDEAGTTFTVYLPVTGEEKPARQESESPDLQGEGIILVVDDEVVQRDIGRRILTKLGYQVETVESGEKAVAYLQTHKVDLVLLDMLMDPGLNGLQTYAEIIKLYPGQKAVIASGFSESKDVKAALLLGVSSFIKKPYKMKNLGLVVKEAIAGSVNSNS
ncbi:MAG: response regulator [Deltaproteobacteria bacterium]|nr:response regulator [Candidatus Tharpella aukensis]